jgi:hypothetical protein
MHVNDIIFDALAEIAASERNDIGDALLNGLSDVITAICLDTGLADVEVRAELTRRVHRIRSEKKQLQMIVSGLENFTDFDHRLDDHIGDNRSTKL